MGIKYLWDTNTAIYYLQQQFPLGAEEFIDNILLQNQPIISVITEIELLCWKNATPNDIIVLNNFINNSVVLELEKDIKFKTASIRKSHKIKLPDAIIAATAIVFDLALLSRNISDFATIEGLNLIDPWSK